MKKKYFFQMLLFLTILSEGCLEQNRKSMTNNVIQALNVVPDTLVKISALSYNHKISLWTLNHVPYSGFAVSYYQDNTLKEKFGILEGKKQDEAIQWFADGHVKNVANYHQGKLHGEKKIWIKDTVHVLIGHYNYLNGMPHGEQKKWYSTGEIFKQMNLIMGKEEGMQRAFRKNGSLYANYEARNGRIFGIKNGKLCYELNNETIVSNE